MPFRLRSFVAVLSCWTLMSLGPGCSHISVKGQPPTAEDCAGASKQTTVGTVLGVVGLVSLGTGVVVAATADKGSPSFMGRWPDYGRMMGGAAAVIGGVALGVVGLSLVGAASTAKSQCLAAEACRGGGAEPCKTPGVSATSVQPGTAHLLPVPELDAMR